MTPYTILLSKILDYREKVYKYTQSEMADLLEVNTKTWKNYEMGKTPIPSDKLLKIAEIFKINPSDLFDNEKDIQLNNNNLNNSIVIIESTTGKLVFYPNDHKKM